MNGYIPSRFISAKDDNESKVLVWGIMTDDHEYMHLSPFAQWSEKAYFFMPVKT